ncbi:MAG: response regulator, partial [Rhodothermales bacterium]|nr:response regulator [Rhodothermales bacterium]
MRCLIVDDEPLARARLSALLQETQRPVEIVGEFGSARDALPAIHEQNPDVVFVDVQMPVLDGFDLVDLIVPPRPPIVFVTAYDEYAIKAFEVQAIDYLTKPVRLERLNRSLDRIHTGSHRASDGSVL